MGCEECRELLSARLDGEDTGDERVLTDAHLADCAGCRGWWDAAAMITRMARTAPVPAFRGVPDTVLAAVPRRTGARAAIALRILLGVLGAIQLVLGIVQISRLTTATAYLHAGHTGDTGHLWHESAAWNITIGAAFLFIATRRTRPASLLPTLTVFVGALVLLSASDIMTGQVASERLLSHGFLLIGYAITAMLTRPRFDFGPPAAPTGTKGKWRVRFDDHESPAVPPKISRPAEGTAHYRRAA